MGLDMFLKKRTHIYREEDKKKIKEFPPELKIDHTKVITIVEEITDWRKANAIHHWFVKNIQKGNDDCGEYILDKTDLKNLLTTINEVLEDRCLARKLLPTEEGFFFGSTEYDQDYYDELKRTRDIIKEELKQTEDTNPLLIDYVYQSSW